MYTNINQVLGKIAVILVTLGTMSLNQAFAEQWYVKPSISAGVTSSDNLRLNTANEISETGYTISPSVEIGTKSEISSITLGVSGSSTRYSGGGINDSDNLRINLGMNRKSERSQMGLNLSFAQLSALTSEQEDSGLLVPGRESDRVTVRPSFSYSLSQKQSVQFSLGHSSLDYDSGAASLVGYTNNDVSGTYSYQASPKNTYTFSVTGSSYESDNSVTESDSVGLSIGVNHSFSETINGSANIGGRKTENTTSGIETDNTGTTFNLSLNKKSIKTTYSASLSRSVSPSSVGQVNESDRFGLSLTHQYSKKISMGLNLNHIQNKSALNAVTATDRKYSSLSPSLNWRLTEKMNLNFVYQYSKQKFDSATSEADSNVFKINFRYLWNPIQINK